MAIDILIFGIVLFVGVHLVPAFSGFRSALVNRLSLNGYKIFFTLVSFLGLGLMIWGMKNAPQSSLWLPPSWGRDAAIAIMFPAMILLAVSMQPTNIKRFTPHPMLWGFVLWAFAHLLANGDLASVILFGSMGVYSAVAILSANQRGAKVSTTSVGVGRESLSLGIGVVVYITLLYLHPYLFGPKLV